MPINTVRPYDDFRKEKNREDKKSTASSSSKQSKASQKKTVLETPRVNQESKTAVEK